MIQKPVRTRYAPSPTGLMHVGNLRTALYEYLIARSQGGSFVLRIEDTDQERLVDGAVSVIYQTLAQVGLRHDEGPDIGGAFGPYVQSERKALYRPYAEQLAREGKAYYCFCSKERLDRLKESAEADGGHFNGYDRHCRDLPAAEVDRLLAAGTPYVIRQKMPLNGSTTFSDAVYGDITVDNSELEDQILLKSDGYPTYNFANVIDDHAMQITHVVRGSEYLSSTPKYNLLYEAFGWDVPTYVHLPLIVGNDGRKLSKRHGATSFADLVGEGYLPAAIINYIALLGWCPKDTRELFTLDELCQVFSIDGISKSPSVFDYDKLDWFNGEYIRAMEPSDFVALIRPELDKVFAGRPYEAPLLAELLQPRLIRLTQLPAMIHFLVERQDYSLDLFYNKKNKVSPDQAKTILPVIRQSLADLPLWTREAVHDSLMALAAGQQLKTGQVMWPLRIALSGQEITPGGAIEIAVILGREESLARLQLAIGRLNEQQ
ncbi:MAG: glutamate--tRNA ligase [Clostridiaceae bacterium]|nr:glutamate--tRNA ligase [Clostridiaceae bacterium]